MNDNSLALLKAQFEKITGIVPVSCVLLPQTASNRKYYRMSSEKVSFIGAFNPDVKENRAFVSFSHTFASLGLKVPEVLSVSDDYTTYLQTDIGDETLFSFLQKKRAQVFPASVIEKYKQVLSELPRFQKLGGEHIDFSKSYPRAAFDKQSMMWDLNYFKYYFLKLSGVAFDEQLLENDYTVFVDYLLSEKSDYFLYRDFQSRNIMLKNNEIYFIDYQGGRKGPLQYDVASLLYDAKADIPEEIRKELLDYYLDRLAEYVDIDRKAFVEKFYAFVLIRIMQAMGAYGYRGFYEKKTHFLQSIPYALKNLKTVMEKCRLPREISHLTSVLAQLGDAPGLRKYTRKYEVKTTLTVNVVSFSYKKELPGDTSGNGGGYIFDCRAIHNPGRYEQYKSLTGRDKEVIDFLRKDGEADGFLSAAFQLVEQSVDKYLDRGFTHLQVSFGCTGGQHRSVFCAENTARHLKEKYGDKVKIVLNHREQNIFETL